MRTLIIVISLFFVSSNGFAQVKVQHEGHEYTLAIQKIELEEMVLVKERFPVNVKITVLSYFKKEDIPKIHRLFGPKYAISVQESVVNNAIRIVFGKYTLEELLVLKRELFENELSMHIEKKFTDYHIQLISHLPKTFALMTCDACKY